MIQTPEDIEGKSIEELQKLHREISFQLKIVNSALKDHTREAKMRQFFEKYPYYLDKDGEVYEADIEKILNIERAGFGYDNVGLPVWGESYGMGGEEYTCLETKEDATRVTKLRTVVAEVIALHNHKSEPVPKKLERVDKILEGFSK